MKKVIVLVLVLFTFFLSSCSTIVEDEKISKEQEIYVSEAELLRGKSIDISYANKLFLELSQGEFSPATITVQNPEKASINFGYAKYPITEQKRNFDTDNDGKLDLFLILKPSSSGTVDIYIQKLTKAPPFKSKCLENWSCDYWLECDVEGKRYRTCTDKNNCGTSENKPEEMKSCAVELNEKDDTCFGIGGKICDSGTSCSGEITSSSNSDACCLGTCPTISTGDDSCQGIVCDSPVLKCINGKCRKISCTVAGGNLCDLRTSICQEGFEKTSECYTSDDKFCEKPDQLCCLSGCGSAPYDVSLSGPIKITENNGKDIRICPGSVAHAEFDVTSTFPETVSLGHYKIYIDGIKEHEWSSLKVEPGINKFYARLTWVKDVPSFSTIKIVFDCGHFYIEKETGNFSIRKEASCENNELEATINYINECYNEF